MWRLRWDELDKTPDPKWFVDFLDTSRRGAFGPAQQDPKKRFAYLQIDEGHSILDVGCGTGVFTMALAPLVGRTGRVVGVDFSETMVQEARRRAEGSGLPVEYRRGDAHHLEFPDGTFDRVVAAALLQHLASPRQAVAEMARVAKPGGLVSVFEHDWGTLFIDSGHREITRRIVDFYCDAIRNGWVGRQLPGLFREAGLTDIHTFGIPVVVPDAYDGLASFLIDPAGEGAVEAGLVTEDEFRSWRSDLEERGGAARLLWGFLAFTAVGQKS